MSGSAEQELHEPRLVDMSGRARRPARSSSRRAPVLNSNLPSRVRGLAAAVLAREEQSGTGARDEEDDSEGEAGADAGVVPLEAGRAG